MHRSNDLFVRSCRSTGSQTASMAIESSMHGRLGTHGCSGFRTLGPELAEGRLQLEAEGSTWSGAVSSSIGETSLLAGPVRRRARPASCLPERARDAHRGAERWQAALATRQLWSRERSVRLSNNTIVVRAPGHTYREPEGKLRSQPPATSTSVERLSFSVTGSCQGKYYYEGGANEKENELSWQECDPQTLPSILDKQLLADQNECDQASDRN